MFGVLNPVRDKALVVSIPALMTTRSQPTFNENNLNISRRQTTAYKSRPAEVLEATNNKTKQVNISISLILFLIYFRRILQKKQFFRSIRPLDKENVKH